MSTQEKTKKRTTPWKKAHRKMLELTLTDSVKDMMLKQILMLEKSKLRATRDMDEYLLENVVEAVIEAANEKLPPSLRQDSLQMYSSDAMWKFSINQQIRRWFDDRAHQATAYVMDFIEDHKQTSTDSDMKMMIDWLEGMFFGASRKKKFKFTPQLHDFMTKDPKQLTDDRLKKAQQILKDAYHSERSKWYYKVERFCEETNEYISLEDYLYAPKKEEADDE